jgi:hypothetical protein
MAMRVISRITDSVNRAAFAESAGDDGEIGGFKDYLGVESIMVRGLPRIPVYRKTGGFQQRIIVPEIRV